MARIPQDSQPETASELATLGPRYKVQIPISCIEVVTWPRESPVRLIVELLRPGCVRLHLSAQITTEIQARRAEIQRGNDSNRLELLSVMDDRYRAVSLYTKGSENSVTFEERVVAYLGVLPSDNATIFVEATKETIDIMSLSYRNRRLDLLKDSTSV